MKSEIQLLRFYEVDLTMTTFYENSVVALADGKKISILAYMYSTIWLAIAVYFTAPSSISILTLFFPVQPHRMAHSIKQGDWIEWKVVTSLHYSWESKLSAKKYRSLN